MKTITTFVLLLMFGCGIDIDADAASCELTQTDPVVYSYVVTGYNQ